MGKKIVLLCFTLLLLGCGSQRILQKEQVSPSIHSDDSSREIPDADDVWRHFQDDSRPWVENISQPYHLTQGLQGRHLSVWASHGRYFDQKKGEWKWQRPYLFGTTEDLFTQTIVVPYLIPMLEKAGAYVFTPRERDWQRNEIIVDNDSPYLKDYSERNMMMSWTCAGVKGFASHDSMYTERENPFEAGTARKIRATKNDFGGEIIYQPRIPKAGKYAVYVSYVTLPNSVPDAKYTVYHKGQASVFKENQRIGGGTWTYLGTFDFDEGSNIYNRVVLSSKSDYKGVVTADAVRLGGGMGNIERGGTASGMPRCLEGARYYAQWAGAPDSVYNSKNGQDDYGDDINTRSYMTNWLAGGSRYMPNAVGKKVPIDLALAIHSDAGYSKDYQSLVGSLAICTTGFNDSVFNSGASRILSRTFAGKLLEEVNRDLTITLNKQWIIRELRDANYSETRNPEVPSSILETLSHQNFPDMKLAQDPNFRFVLARSIYKAVLKFISSMHDKAYAVVPLPPENLSVEFTTIDGVTLTWDGTDDPSEPTAAPTSYIIYTAKGKNGFDNGTVVKGNSYDIRLEPGVVYQFKVAALNKGGESFPSETMSALYHAGATRSIMVVNGFYRLSAPAVRETATEQGFDFDKDPGVGYGSTVGWSGRQLCFDKKMIGIEGPGGLGYSGNEWEGKLMAGNDFNHVVTHVEAMRSLQNYNVTTCSLTAVESGKVDLMKYHIVDLVLGLEKFNRYSVKNNKIFTPQIQDVIKRYTKDGGALMVSGAYIGSDMAEKSDSLFVNNVLKIKYGGNLQADSDSIITGMGTSFSVYKTLNETHYAATSTDIVQPLKPAYCALTYPGGLPACVAYAGNDYHAFTMGFPFECITSPRKRSAVMRGIINFLIEK